MVEIYVYKPLNNTVIKAITFGLQFHFTIPHVTASS